MSNKLTFRIDPDTRVIHACVDTFEQADEETQKDLTQFLRDVPTRLQHSALVELVKVDFERRWKRGQRRAITDYLAQYPDLASSEASLRELLQVEYDFRTSAGETPNLDDYHRICPSFAPSHVAGEPSTETEPLSQTAEGPPSSDVKTIGRYVIRKKIGEGGFGVVYLAHDPQLDREVAIKLSKHQRGKNSLGADQLHEARSVTRLNHPGIVKIYDINESPDGAYIVYEYVKGESLERRLFRGNYQVPEAAEWVAQVAEALHHAHGRGVIHRDIKPGNILIDLEGRAKVVDFGLARRDDHFYVQDAGRLLGTIAYMSPEQAEGNPHFASALTDLYSLGVVLYETICQRRPFQSKSVDELLDLVKHCPPPPPSSLVKVDAALESVCLKAIAKVPDERYRNGEEMARQVREAIAPRNPGWIKWVRGAAAVIAIGAIAVLAALAVRPTTRVEPLRIQNVLVHIKGGTPIDKDATPLTGGDQIEVQGRLMGTNKAYNYLVRYTQDTEPEFLSPPEDRLDSVLPGYAATDLQVSVPNRDGATFLAVLSTVKALTKDQVASLKALKLTFPHSPSEIGQEQVWFPSAIPVLPGTNNKEEIQRGETKFGPLEMPEDFKQALAKILDIDSGNGAFAGRVISHKASLSTPMP